MIFGVRIFFQCSICFHYESYMWDLFPAGVMFSALSVRFVLSSNAIWCTLSFASATNDE